MTWGVFEIDDQVHVAPCDEDGKIEPPHILDDLCVCQPDVEWLEKEFVNHRTMH